MTTPLAPAPPRFHSSNIIAACIVGISLIVSASILAHRPVALTPASPIAALAPSTAAAALTEDGRPKVAPPLAQESVAKQFREQVMNSQAVRTLKFNGQSYTLADVRVKQVIYDAKSDEFVIDFEWLWPQGAPKELPGNTVASFSNDGYGHYWGHPLQNGTAHFADVTLR